MPHPTRYESAASIPLPSDTESQRIIGTSYDRAKTWNVEKMAAGAEDMYHVFLGMVKAIFETADIDAKTRELIILRSAKLMNSPYEWQAKDTMARNSGCTQTEIDAVAADGQVVGIDEHYVLICKATDELSRDATLSDKTLLEMQARYDDVPCRKVVVTIAWFSVV